MTSVHRLIHLWAAVTWLDVIKNWAGSGGWRGVEVSEKAMRYVADPSLDLDPPYDVFTICCELMLQWTPKRWP
jgi:hypothetical protein